MSERSSCCIPRYPTVTIVNAADVSKLFRRWSTDRNRGALCLSFAILAGAIVLASSWPARGSPRPGRSHFRHLRRYATRVSLFSSEFIVRRVGGLMGSILATAFSALLLQRFSMGFRFDWVPNLLQLYLPHCLPQAPGGSQDTAYSGRNRSKYCGMSNPLS